MTRVGDIVMKEYTEQEVKDSIDKLVKIDFYRDKYWTTDLEIIKVTAKQATVKQEGRMFEETVRFSNVGAINGGAGYILTDDIDEVAHKYRLHTLEYLNKRKESIEESIREAENMKRRYLDK